MHKTKENISNFFNEDKLTINKKDKFEDINFEEKVKIIYKNNIIGEPDISIIKKYANQLKFKLITEEKLASIFKAESNSQLKNETTSPIITYCMMGGNKLKEIQPYLENILPYIDHIVYVDSYSTDGSADYIKSLATDKITMLQEKWNDKFSEFRNNYLNYLKTTKYNGWVIVSDTDEQFPEESLKEIRKIIPTIESEGYTGISVQVEDISVDDDDFNKVISRHINEYWKSLIFKYHPNLQYRGEPHETLVGHDIKWYRSNIIYQHKRSKLHILSRACENFFISNSNRYSEKWSEFRVLCTENNLNTFKEFWKLFENHNLPKNIEEWIRKHKNDNEDTGDSEVREMYILYNEYLPERKKKNLKIPLTSTISTSTQIPNYTITNPHILRTEIGKSIYDITPYICQNCNLHKPLIELMIDGKRIVMCTDCILIFADHIKTKCEEIK